MYYCFDCNICFFNNTIPMHYNFNGEVDRYGNKWEIWIAYIAGIILYFGLSVIERKPQYWNTGITITEKNK